MAAASDHLKTTVLIVVDAGAAWHIRASHAVNYAVLDTFVYAVLLCVLLARLAPPRHQNSLVLLCVLLARLAPPCHHQNS